MTKYSEEINKIINKKSLHTELKEKVKAEEVYSSDSEELPNTGETNNTNFVLIATLSLLGVGLLLSSKLLKEKH